MKTAVLVSRPFYGIALRFTPNHVHEGPPRLDKASGGTARYGITCASRNDACVVSRDTVSTDSLPHWKRLARRARPRERLQCVVRCRRPSLLFHRAGHRISHPSGGAACMRIFASPCWRFFHSIDFAVTPNQFSTGEEIEGPSTVSPEYSPSMWLADYFVCREPTFWLTLGGCRGCMRLITS